jgi:hypothetical protein
MADEEWLFQCPECSFSHIEFECFGADDEVHCIVCLEERQATIRLRRWRQNPMQHGSVGT